MAGEHARADSNPNRLLGRAYLPCRLTYNRAIPDRAKPADKNVMDSNGHVGLRGQLRQDESQRRLRQELISNTERWLRSVQLRAFIEATCKANAGSPAHVQDQTALWAAWATAQADRLDPIQADTGSVINLTATAKDWFTGHSMRPGENDWWLE